MFEIESKNQDRITISTKQTTITFDVAECVIDAGLGVGKIRGAGEFEIGDVAIRGIGVEDNNKIIYDAEINGVHIGIVGGVENGLDDLNIPDVLCTSSVRAIKEINPKMVVSMGNLDAMVTELKVTAKVEKKIKIKNVDALPSTLEVVALS